MLKHDVTKTNIAIDELLKTTHNPRHKFMLLAYYRHRYLELAGRYEEIFAPDMTVEEPAYHVHLASNKIKLVGQDAVKSLYRMWADTNQCIFYAENEQVAVATIISPRRQSFTSRSPERRSISTRRCPICRASSPSARRESSQEQGRDAGREFDVSLLELHRDDLALRRPGTAGRRERMGAGAGEGGDHQARSVGGAYGRLQAAEKLNPLIKPLPSFDEMVLARKAA